jgi:hypothetical protein
MPLKPARWAAHPGAIAPEWRWAWRGLRLAVIGWEGGGVPGDVIGRAPGSLTGTLTWEASPTGLVWNLGAAGERIEYGTAAEVGVTGLATDSASFFAYARMDGAGSGFQYILHRSPGGTGSQPFSPLVTPGAPAELRDWNKEAAELPADPNGDGLYHAYGIVHEAGGAAGDGRFYFDGQRLATAASGGGSWTDSAQPWTVGGNPEPNHAFIGPIACVYLWDRELTDDEHRMLADDPFGPLRPAPATATTVGAITGSGTATAAAAQVSGAGAVTVTGSGTATAAAASATGSGAVTVAGSGTATAGAAAASGSGSVTVTGSGAASPAAASTSGAGAVTVDGHGAILASGAIISGSGAVVVTGAGAAIAPAAVVSGAEAPAIVSAWPPSAGAPTVTTPLTAGEPVTAQPAAAGEPAVGQPVTAGAPTVS